ncbi:MAG: hypothetical protein M1823_001270 [Watsoniomyces obsoletus]|nr:MAG: hypothetical protein M1823_001270 [Watsoniomyces obsoletus]
MPPHHQSSTKPWDRLGFIWPCDRPSRRRGFRGGFLDILQGKGPDMYISNFRQGPVLDWVDWARYPEFGPIPWRYDDSSKTPPWARRGDHAYDLKRRKYVRRGPVGMMDPWNLRDGPVPMPLGFDDHQLQQQMLQQQRLLQQQQGMWDGNAPPWIGAGGGQWVGGEGFATPHFRNPFSKSRGGGRGDEHLWYPPGGIGGGGRYPPTHLMSNVYPEGMVGAGRPRTGDFVNARRPRKTMPTSFEEAMNDFRPAIVNGKNRENWVWNPHLMNAHHHPGGYSGRYPHHPHHPHHHQQHQHGGRRRRHGHRRRSSIDDYSEDDDDDDLSSEDWLSSDEDSLRDGRRRAPWHHRRRTRW